MKHIFCNFLFLLFVGFFIPIIASDINNNKSADLVIFSYDRPLQLYSLLESIQKYVTGIATTTVIYRTSSDAYAHAYDQVFTQFSHAKPYKQGSFVEQDFKPLTLKATYNSPSAYVLFAVDDIIVKDYINIEECVNALESTQAYGFYLRLGLHLDYCYSIDRKQQLPSIKPVSDTIFAWQLMDGAYDWGYPHTVDMTLYRKKDIKLDLYSMNYSSPNTFESIWSTRTSTLKEKIGLCYQTTKIVNIPLNRVQSDINNRNMNAYSAADLLTAFNNNYKINIEPLFAVNNVSAHMPYNPELIKR